MQPGADVPPAVLGGDLDGEPGADEEVGLEPRDEPLGGPLQGERDLVHPVERRLEVDRPVPVLRLDPGHGPARIEAGSHPVCRRARRPEPVPDLIGVERGEGAERADAELREHRGELRHADQRHREGGEEGRAAAGRHGADPAGGVAHPRGLLGGERAVRDPHPRLRHARGREEPEHGLGGGALAAEVPGRPLRPDHDHAGSHHLHGGDARLQGEQHRFEPPRVRRRVHRQHREGRAPRLGLPQAQPPSHPGRPRRRGAGRDDALLDEGDRLVRLDARLGCRGPHRPVGAPDHHGPLGRAAHTASSRTGRDGASRSGEAGASMRNPPGIRTRCSVRTSRTVTATSASRPAR